MRKWKAKTLGIALVFLFSEKTFSQNNQEEADREWYFKASLNGSYSSGLSDPHYSYGPEVEASWQIWKINLYAGSGYDFNYQLSGGDGTFESISLATYYSGFDLNILKGITLSADYRGGAGSSDFSRHGLNSRLYIDSGSFGFLIGFLYGQDTYEYQNNSIDVISYTATGAVYWYYSDKMRLEAGCDYLSNSFSNLAGNYNSFFINSGLLYVFSDYFDMNTNLGYGLDSDEYNIFEIGLGVSFAINERMSLSLSYTFSLYSPTEDIAIEEEAVLSDKTTAVLDDILFQGPHSSGQAETSGSSDQSQGESLTGGYSSNPYIKSSLIGETIFDHYASIRVEYSY